MKPSLRRIVYWSAPVLALSLVEIFVAQNRLEFVDSLIGFGTLGIWLAFLWRTKGSWRLVQTGILMLLSGAGMLIAYVIGYAIFEDPLTRIDESALLIAGPVGALLVVVGLVWVGIFSTATRIRRRRSNHL